MIMYLFQVTVCLACFYGFYCFALRKETMFDTNRLYLMATLILSLVLPIIKIYIDAQSAASNVVVASSLYVGNYVQDFSTISPTPIKVIPWFKILTGIYVLGVSVMTIRFLLALKQLLDIRKDGIQRMVSGCQCILSEKVRSPFSFFKTIYLPVQHTFTEAELNEVIAHEMAHVRGLHTWDVILMEVLCIKLWPSPMIYLYRKSLKEVHEYVADAAVLKDTPWENYARLLVSQQHSQLQNILSNQLIYSQLKKRLVMMNQKRSGFTARYKYLGFIPVLLIALLFFSFREKPTSGTHLAIDKSESRASDKVLLYVTNDQRYFIGLQEVRKSDIEATVKEAIKEIPDPQVVVLVDNPKDVEVGELAAILDIGFRLHMDWVCDLDEEGKYDSYKSAVRGSNTNSNKDTMPESSLISLRLTEPAQAPAIAEDYTKLDYTLEMPIFPGCDNVAISDRGTCGMEKLGEYINAHMVYPESLKKSGKEGRVLVKFVVDANGYVKDVAIQQSLDPAADQAVLNLVNGMNGIEGKWRPARKEGKSYDAEMILPVTFSLGEYNSAEDTKTETEPYAYVEEMPRFNGCEDVLDSSERFKCTMGKLFEFIGQHIQYPKEDKEKKIEGQGIVHFVVEADGSLTDIRVLRSPSPTISAEIMRMMNIMASIPDAWIPGKKDGVAVPVQFTLPVKFKLESDPPVPMEKGIDQGSTFRLGVTPNPASSEITVDVFEGAKTLWIINSSGVHVQSLNLSEGIERQRVDVSSLKPGQYVVQVNSEAKTMSSSFVKI